MVALSDCDRIHEEVVGVIAASSLGESLWVIVCNVAKSFANVAYTGSLILMFAMAAVVVVYSKRRPPNAPLTWGEAMAASVYVTFGLFWAFGVVPHQWLTYAQGDLNMRSDAILAGPGSTGLAEWSPIVISKQTVADSLTIGLYGLAFTMTLVLWSVWQKRGKKTDEVETSTYGRPLVKA